jgi:hypothetical protein
MNKCCLLVCTFERVDDVKSRSRPPKHDDLRHESSHLLITCLPLLLLLLLPPPPPPPLRPVLQLLRQVARRCCSSTVIVVGCTMFVVVAPDSTTPSDVDHRLNNVSTARLEDEKTMRGSSRRRHQASF